MLHHEDLLISEPFQLIHHWKWTETNQSYDEYLSSNSINFFETLPYFWSECDCQKIKMVCKFDNFYFLFIGFDVVLSSVKLFNNGHNWIRINEGLNTQQFASCKNTWQQRLNSIYPLVQIMTHPYPSPSVPSNLHILFVVSGFWNKIYWRICALA